MAPKLFSHQYLLAPMIWSDFQHFRISGSIVCAQLFHTFTDVMKGASPFGHTAVKSNALAELMNRASKIHWKNLSLTLNGRNSETKNDKDNPKVPKFSSCRGLSSTLSRKCGSTTLCGCLWVFCGCLWVFLGVCGCQRWHYLALFGSNMPLGPLGKEKKENLLPQQK